MFGVEEAGISWLCSLYNGWNSRNTRLFSSHNASKSIFFYLSLPVDVISVELFSRDPTTLRQKCKIYIYIFLHHCFHMLRIVNPCPTNWPWCVKSLDIIFHLWRMCIGGGVWVRPFCCSLKNERIIKDTRVGYNCQLKFPLLSDLPCVSQPLIFPFKWL